MNATDIDRMLRPLSLKDLRTLSRERGLSPAGGKEQLEDRLKQNMMQTGNYNIQPQPEGGAAPPPGMPQGYSVAPQGYEQYTTGNSNNNYARPAGQQNVGNFITDRNSSHVMAPPGGRSTIQLGSYENPHTNQPQASQAYGQGYAQGSPMQQQQPGDGHGATNQSHSNNYSRPGGQQNVGNFITDRPSSKVMAPPGGASQISFGDYNMPPPQAAQQHRQVAPPPYGVAPQQPGAPYGYGGPGQAPPPGRPGDSQQAGIATGNNYSRPGGQQNVGNFLTDRPSSRVLAPPGGKSQISFG